MDWRPIKTAPRNGERILLVVEDSIGIYHYGGDTWYGVMDKPISLDSDYEPELWQPLPPLPTSTK